MKNIKYIKPRTEDEVVRLLKQLHEEGSEKERTARRTARQPARRTARQTAHQSTSLIKDSRTHERVRMLAGGTDLLVQLKTGEIYPEYIVDLKGVSDLKSVDFNSEEGLSLGALVTLREVETSTIIKSRYPEVAEAARIIGSVQIRNRATIGGNICNAAPSADMVPILIGLKAKARIFGAHGERRIDIESFFQGPGSTVLEEEEFLTHVVIPLPDKYEGSVYLRHTTRRRMDIATISVASVVTLDACKERAVDVRIVLGAAAPTPIRARAAERVLIDKQVSATVIADAAQQALLETRPISDVRATENYRRELVRTYVERTLKVALKRAGFV